MCLDRKGTFKPAEVGYRVMHQQGEQLFSTTFRTNKPQPMGVWLDEKDYRVYSRLTIYTEHTDSPYPVGWHIFNTINGARHWKTILDLTYNGYYRICIVKVEIKRPVARGYQEGYKVTVAKEIKILRIVEGYK